MGTSLYRKVGLATLIMSASVFASRIIGLVREVVIAHSGGATGAVDAYQISFVLPEILNHVVASGFLSITFIPIFSRYLAANREVEGWRVFNIIFTGVGTLLLIFIAIAFYFTPSLVAVLVPGIDDPVLKARAVTMTRIILPAQFFFFAGGLFSAVQFAKERFFLPALAPLIYNLGIIVGGLYFGPQLGMVGFSWGALVGAFGGNFAIQYIGARRVGMRLAVNWKLNHPDFRTYIFLSLPLMVGLTMTFSTEIFFKFFGSFLPPGSIAGLNYALRIMLILVAFFGQAVGVASFPFMARLAVENKIGEMNRLLNNTLRYLALAIPFAVLIMVLRHEVVRLLYQRGQFDAAATHMTAGILVYMMIGAFAFAAQTVVVRGFYAFQNTLFPAVYSTIAVVASIPLYILGLKVMGVNGVALAISVSVTLQVILLFVIWNRRYHNPDGRSIYIFILKAVIASIPLGGAMFWLRRYLTPWIDASTVVGSLLIVIVITGFFGGVLVSGAALFNLREISNLMARLKKKSHRKH